MMGDMGQSEANEIRADTKRLIAELKALEEAALARPCEAFEEQARIEDARAKLAELRRENSQPPS
jgi:hypothetical protein